jgi:ribosome biogenesis GTPase
MLNRVDVLWRLPCINLNHYTEMISLNNFGWNNFFSQYSSKNQDSNLHTGRVISIKGFKYMLISEMGEIEAELSGKLLFVSDQDELPKVGDWIFFLAYDTVGYITDVFPRMNSIYRKLAGKKTEKQVLAANIDYALIVQGLDRDFNLMRLERYLAQMAICNVKPIVVLNKSDLAENHAWYKSEIEKLNRNCPVYFCSTYTGYGMDILTTKIFEPAKTYIMIGSSGVGKSSILNSILPGVRMTTNEVSESTGKGKHTTTTRELFQLPNGSLLIDTPGMREFGVAIDEDPAGANIFPSIDDFALECRYSDCKHINEDGCGVLKALEEGKISSESYQSYLKLIKEQQRFLIKADERKRLGKQFGKMSREAQDYRRKYKY